MFLDMQSPTPRSRREEDRDTNANADDDRHFPAVLLWMFLLGTLSHALWFKLLFLRDFLLVGRG
jgi:hypothetical protein